MALHPRLGGRLFLRSGFWLKVLGWIVSVLVWLILAVLVIFLFVPIGALIASPFNDISPRKPR